LFGFWRGRTAKPPEPIFTIDSQMDVPFGGPENKIYISIPFPPQILGQFLIGFKKYRVKEALTMAIALE